MAAAAMTSAMSDERDTALSSWNGPPRTRERNTDVLAIGPFGLGFQNRLMALLARSVAKPQDVANLPPYVVDTTSPSASMFPLKGNADGKEHFQGQTLP